MTKEITLEQNYEWKVIVSYIPKQNEWHALISMDCHPKAGITSLLIGVAESKDEAIDYISDIMKSSKLNSLA